MELRDTIHEDFEYDLWASRKWVLTLGDFGDQILRAEQVLEHILAAQKVWLERCGVQVWEPDENVALEELFELYCRAWQAQVKDRALSESIVYQTTSGLTFENTLGQIARHVINHGSYHRGQLRGMAESVHFSSFPDTDLIFFLRSRNGDHPAGP